MSLVGRTSQTLPRSWGSGNADAVALLTTEDFDNRKFRYSWPVSCKKGNIPPENPTSQVPRALKMSATRTESCFRLSLSAGYRCQGAQK